MNLSNLSDQCEHVLENFFPFLSFSYFFFFFLTLILGQCVPCSLLCLAEAKQIMTLKANPKGKSRFTMSYKIGSVDKIIVLRQVNLLGFADFF